MAPSHYFTTDPTVASQPRTVHLALTDLSLDLVTDHGVFAYGQIDRGTEILLSKAPLPPPTGDILDIGCGYGPIAIALARRAPEAHIWAIDSNERALALTQSNAAAAKVTNVTAVGADAIPSDVRFAAIYSNPPIHVGKETLHTLLSTWLQRLLPDGHAYLVVHKYLGSDSLHSWLSANGFATTRLRSRQGYRILDVHNTATKPHDPLSHA